VRVHGDSASRELRRAQVLRGGYRLREADGRAPAVTLVAMGAIVPEALAAADELGQAGVAVDVVCLTSADLVFRALQVRQGLAEGEDAVLEELFPPERAAPLVTVLDGHPHTLSFLGAVNDTPIACLGVQDFGQSGDVQDLYRHFGIDAEEIAGAALDLIA
jgi:pyruvate dehydrogenase E1 component